MAKPSKPEIVDVEVLRVALVAAEARADQAEADAAAMKAKLSGDAALIAHLRLEIARLTPHPLRPALRAHAAPHRPVRAAARGTGSLGHRRRSRGREGRHQGRHAGFGGPAEALAPALPVPSVARARRGAGSDRLPVLRRGAPVEDGRGRHRDARSGAAPMDGDPDGA